MALLLLRLMTLFPIGLFSGTFVVKVVAGVVVSVVGAVAFPALARALLVMTLGAGWLDSSFGGWVWVVGVGVKGSDFLWER